MDISKFTYPLVDVTFDDRCIVLGALEIRPEYRKYLSFEDAPVFGAIQAIAMTLIHQLIHHRILDEKAEAQRDQEAASGVSRGETPECLPKRKVRNREWLALARQALLEGD